MKKHTHTTQTAQTTQNGLIKRPHYQEKKAGQDETLSKKLEQEIPLMMLKQYFKETSPSERDLQEYKRRQQNLRFIYS